jgi:hypothetical protein
MKHSKRIANSVNIALSAQLELEPSASCKQQVQGQYDYSTCTSTPLTTDNTPNLE